MKFEIWNGLFRRHLHTNVQRLGTTDLVPHRIDTLGCVIRKQETHNLRSNNQLTYHLLNFLDQALKLCFVPMVDVFCDQCYLEAKAFIVTSIIHQRTLFGSKQNCKI